MSKINIISQRFQLLFKAFLFLYPIMVIGTCMGWFSMFPIEYVASIRLPVDVDLPSLRLTVRILSCLILMIPTVIVMFGFYYLIQLFKLYAKNTIFDLNNVTLIKKIGITFIVQAIANIIIQPVLSIVLTMDAPPGGHVIAIGVGSHEVSNFVIGFIVVLISWIMEEGRKLEEEKQLTI